MMMFMLALPRTVTTAIPLPARPSAGRRMTRGGVPVRKLLAMLAFMTLASLPIAAQPGFQDPLLDHLIGKWILHGTMDGKETTHDIDAEWVLGHEYLRLHEVKRDRNGKDQSPYEAIIFIGWDAAAKQYACLWLDSTSGNGLTNGILGRAKRGRDEIAFVFTYKNGSTFHTTFAYSNETDTWQWLMDGEENGMREPFARVTLTRR
jgi:hypothetical protein